MIPNPDVLKEVGYWLTSEHTGESSKYLCALYLGAEPRYPKRPYDVADLNRCYLFLELLYRSEQVAVLARAAKSSTEWGKLVARWDELWEVWHSERTYDRKEETYKLMKEILK